MSQNPGLFRRQNDHALEKPPHSTTGVASEVQLQFWKSLHFTPGQHQVRRVHYMCRPKRSIRYSGAHVPVARPIRSRLASLLVITETRIDKRAAVLRLAKQRTLTHGSGTRNAAPGPLRPRRGGDRKAKPSACGGLRSASGTLRPETADGGRAACRGPDPPARSRSHRISTLNHDFSCLKRG